MMSTYAVRVVGRSGLCRNVIIQALSKKRARTIVKSALRPGEAVGRAWEQDESWIRGGHCEEVKLSE